MRYIEKITVFGDRMWVMIKSVKSRITANLCEKKMEV